MAEREQVLKMRRKSKKGLLKSELHLLLTGDPCPPKGCWRDIGESWVRPFVISRDELFTLWEMHKAEIMRQWKVQGKRGLPWAAKQFDK